MSERIDVKQYEADRSKVLELTDGSTWTVRVPRDGDRHTWNKLSQEWRERLKQWNEKLKDIGEKERERLEKEESDVTATERNKRITEAQAAQEEPEDVRDGYLDATQLAVLIEEEPTPEQVIEELSPALRNALIQWAVDILRGGQGKNLLREQKEK